MSLDVGIRVADVIRGLTERGFNDAAGAVVSAITNTSNTGIIQQRLSELSDEAIRLAEAGGRLTTDNAVMRALLADMDDVIAANRVLMNSASGQLQQAAFSSADLVNRQLPLIGLDDATRQLISANWNSVDPQVMQELVSFVDNPVWEAQLQKYGDDVAQIIKNQVIQGQVRGWGPIQMADAISNIIQGAPGGAGFPTSNAENMMRTLQMQSFRTAQTVNRVANSDVLQSQIRVAALDQRTCLACISLHGEEFPLDERIDDHHRGRCTSIPVVKGRPGPQVESGESWWNSLSDERRFNQAGEANFNALEAGAVELRDYVQPYDDAVFGEMLRESSLKGILGDSAEQYYARNQ